MGSLRPGQIVMMASGVIVLIFSFTEQVGDGDNAWSEFGLQTFPALFGIVVAGVVALAAFSTVQLPDRLLTMRVNQWLVILGLTAMLIMVGYWRVFANLADLGSEEEVTATFWLGFLGSIGMFVGAVLEQTADAAPSDPSTAPTPF